MGVAMQLATPGLGCTPADTTVGMNLIMVHHNVVYTHLSAFSPEGYRERAATPFAGGCWKRYVAVSVG